MRTTLSLIFIRFKAFKTLSTLHQRFQAIIIVPRRDRKYSDSGYKERSCTQNDARKQKESILKQVKYLIV